MEKYDKKSEKHQKNNIILYCNWLAISNARY